MPRQTCSLPELQESSFRENGYVHLEGFFAREQVDDLRKLSDELSAQPLDIIQSAPVAGESLALRAETRTSELIVVAEATNPAQVCRYEYMMGSSSGFRKFVATYVQPAVSAVVGQAVAPFKDKTNEKLPGGGAFRPHQDFAAYQFFKPRYHVTAQLSVDPATAENGCIQFSSNLGALAARRHNFVAGEFDGKMLLWYNNGGPNHGDIRPDVAAELRWQPVESGPADLLIFDSFVPHWSDVNRS